MLVLPAPIGPVSALACTRKWKIYSPLVSTWKAEASKKSNSFSCFLCYFLSKGVYLMLAVLAFSLLLVTLSSVLQFTIASGHPQFSALTAVPSSRLPYLFQIKPTTIKTEPRVSFTPRGKLTQILWNVLVNVPSPLRNVATNVNMTTWPRRRTSMV